MLVRSWWTDGLLVCSGEEAVPAKKTKTVISASDISQTRQMRVEKVGRLELVQRTQHGPQELNWGLPKGVVLTILW